MLATVRRFGLQGFVLFAPFSAWLALNGWLRLPVDFLLLALLASLPAFAWRLARKPGSFLMATEDVLLLVIAALGWVSFFFGSGTAKSFNHAMSFSFCLIGYCILFKRMWADAGLGLDHLFKLCCYAVLLGDGIVIVEWLLLNGANILIRPWFILNEKVSNMLFYEQFFFYSVGGTAEEPSLMCFNVNALFPLGWYWLSQRMPSRARAFLALHLVAVFFTASSGGIGFLAIGFAVAYALEFDREQLLRAVAGVLGLVALVVVGYLLLPEVEQARADLFAGQIVSKLTMTNASADMREDAWSKGIADFLASPWIGRGPAFGNEAYRMFGYQSYYIKLAAELGVFALLAQFLFIVALFIRVAAVSQPLRRYLIIACVASVGHWAIADAYYHVSFWITICAVQLLFWEANARKKTAKVELAHA